jgi:hypothetical protein
MSSIPHELVFTALAVALILFLLMLVLVVVLISQAQEHRIAHSFGRGFAFVVTIIGLCALVALGMISTKVPKVKSFSTSFDRG